MQFVNAGSVGNSKDGDHHAHYALLTIENDTLTVGSWRVSYDVARLTDSIRQADLPLLFAQ